MGSNLIPDWKTLLDGLDLDCIGTMFSWRLKMNQSKMFLCAGVKSFAERFGERCQERSTQSSSAGGAAQPKTFTVTPSAVTPNTRMVQERLRAAQTSATATADLTQRQKMVGFQQRHADRSSSPRYTNAELTGGLIAGAGVGAGSDTRSLPERKEQGRGSSVGGQGQGQPACQTHQTNERCTTSSTGDVTVLPRVNLQEPLGQPAETKVGPPSEPQEEVSSEATPPSQSSDTPVKRITPGIYLLDWFLKMEINWCTIFSRR